MNETVTRKAAADDRSPATVSAESPNWIPWGYDVARAGQKSRKPLFKKLVSSENIEMMVWDDKRGEFAVEQ